MIELLSRHSDIFGEPHGIVIEPLPIGEDVSSLSAIIMDDDFIIHHCTQQAHKRNTSCRFHGFDSIKGKSVHEPHCGQTSRETCQ